MTDWNAEALHPSEAEGSGALMYGFVPSSGFHISQGRVPWHYMTTPSILINMASKKITS